MSLGKESEFITDLERERTFRRRRQANRRRPQGVRMKNPPRPNPTRPNENPPPIRGAVNPIPMVNARNRAIRDCVDPAYMSLREPSLGLTKNSI